MWPFDLFKKKPKGLYPESLWTIKVDEIGFTGTDYNGTKMAVALNKLGRVAIETNDSGPWGADVIWLLFNREGKLSCAFPQGATGEDAALRKLMSLPGFDERKMIEAMGCADNAFFVVWQSAELQPQ